MTENLKLNDIKNEVRDIHLPYTEMDDAVCELLDKAYRLGWEEGYDDAKTKFIEIIMRLENK